MSEIEIWVTVADFPNYKVSNHGRVKRIRRTFIRKDGVVSHVKESIKKQCKTKGHWVTRLADGNRDQCCYVHRLIAKAFISNPNNKPYINHIDGNKSNNDILNLEWCTSSENNQHAINNGLRAYRTGHYHVFSVFSESDVSNIRDMYKSGCRIADITRLYNRSRGAISNAAKGISYKNIILAK